MLDLGWFQAFIIVLQGCAGSSSCSEREREREREAEEDYCCGV
ncbi:hypothetical protein KC19_VG075400 [Ceratodon purpureus]|uniref:Uncharacterized protein n=1 Tax=Ceratodon purpureus TaxID=3225 RepID=A0A8T0HNL5_CERPU|nr:hypothetical protein KC19_VG075400 [Ceratodon purpureus]